jgi:hypothetical protein
MRQHDSGWMRGSIVVYDSSGDIVALLSIFCELLALYIWRRIMAGLFACNKAQGSKNTFDLIKAALAIILTIYFRCCAFVATSLTTSQAIKSVLSIYLNKLLKLLVVLYGFFVAQYFLEKVRPKQLIKNKHSLKNGGICDLAQSIREALLAQGSASSEQQALLNIYKQEFSWINNIVFDKNFKKVNRGQEAYLSLVK